MYNPRQVILYCELKQATLPNAIEHMIEESLKAYTGQRTQIHIEEVDDETLKISITDAPDLIPCSFNQGVAILNEL